MLNFIEEALDEVALAVECEIAVAPGLSVGFGGNYRAIPMTADIEAILRPLRKHHKIAVFTFVAGRTRKDRWGTPMSTAIAIR